MSHKTSLDLDCQSIEEELIYWQDDRTKEVRDQGSRPKSKGNTFSVFNVKINNHGNTINDSSESNMPLYFGALEGFNRNTNCMTKSQPGHAYAPSNYALSCQNYAKDVFTKNRLSDTVTNNNLGSDCVSQGYKLHEMTPLDSDVYSKANNYSHPVTKSQSENSLGSESTLGTTLANSLKLISTSNLPLEQSPPGCTQFSAPTTPKSHGLLLQPHTPEGKPEVSNDSEVPAFQKRKNIKEISPLGHRRRHKTKSSVSNVSSSKKIKKCSYEDLDLDLKTEDPVSSKDSNVTLFQCEVCYKMFNRKQTLRQHFITHTDRFPCPFCKVRCKSKGDLRTHIQTHTKEKPFHCEVCNTNYTRESILRKHQTTQTHKKAVMALENGFKMTRGSLELSASVPGFSEVKFEGISCDRCDRVFLSMAELRRHRKSHFLNFRCKLCSRRCATLNLLKFHMKSHSKNNSLTCKICSRSFPKRFLMKDHMKYHQKARIDATRGIDWKSFIEKHNFQEVTPTYTETAKTGAKRQKQAKWSCRMCSKAYINKKSLENHEKVHHCYNCAICDQRFPTLSKLKMHMKHHGKPYKCDICESPYFDQNEFKDHVDKHHNQDEDFKCKICYSEFESATEFQFHMQNHAPTMLFSGASLDESSIPVHKTKKCYNTVSGITKVSDSESSSEFEEDQGDNHSRKHRRKVDRKFINTNGFLEQISNAIIELYISDEDSDENDSDDELLYALKAVTESEFPDSPCISDTEEQTDLKETYIYTQEQVIDKYSDEFALHSEENFEENIFTCKLCDLTFLEKYLLQEHFLEHVCEYCNTFFSKKDFIQFHKEEHRKELVMKIRNEADRIKPSLKDMVSSDSSDNDEDEETDGFLSEMENVLDCKLNRVPPNSLQSLSHDEIIRANKKVFERYSCIDSASSIFACTICKRKYARPTTLTRHFKTHVCPYCNQFFEDKADLLEHKYKHRKEAFVTNNDTIGDKKKIPSSPMVSKVNRELFKKFSFVDSSRNLNRCTLCCKNFVRRTVLTRHMKTHICSHCDKFYEDKYDLAKHIANTRSDLYYSDGEQDDYADYEDDEQPFTGHAAVGDRTKLVTIPPAFSTGLSHFQPAFTPGISGDNQTLTYIQIPSTEGGEIAANQMFTTTPGGSTFQIISEPDTNPESFLVAPANGAAVDPGKLMGLSQPQMIPDENDDRQRLYECEECGKRFFKNGHLKSHMLTHSGDKPFACRLCGKSFSRATTLRKHEKTHMKRCKICDSTFSYKYELDIHMEIHRTYAFYK